MTAAKTCSIRKGAVRENSLHVRGMCHYRRCSSGVTYNSASQTAKYKRIAESGKNADSDAMGADGPERLHFYPASRGCQGCWPVDHT